MSLETDIDDLYKGPLGEFTAARNALAKKLSGDDARRVKALAKPTIVPWTVNQLYWHGRQAYTRLMAAGDALRAAQIEALEGKAARMAKAADAHKTALAAAVKEATRFAAQDGARPSADDISRTLEALSLAAERPSPPGRLTEAVAPAGFEALLGMSIAAPPEGSEGRKQKEKEKTEKAAAAARRALETEIQSAERDLERARFAEAAKREAFERATEERRRAEAALASLRAQLE
jgi:hypothetical protein